MNLTALQEAVIRRFHDILEESLDYARHVNPIWGRLCDSLDITRLADCADYGPNGQVLEDLVVVVDPCPGGMWLEMTHDTARKILVLGMP